MTISEEDYEALCEIARQLNNDDELIPLWYELNDIINNIK